MRNFLCSLFLLFVFVSVHAQSEKEILFVGTYSVRGSEGIYVFEFDRKAVSFKLLQTISGPKSPNFLAIHPSGKFLYSSNSGGLDSNPKSGSISAYAIDGQSRKLQALNSKSSFGAGPCHIAIDQAGKFAYVSQYNEGTLGVHSILPDGSLGELTDSARYEGKSVNPDRQKKPYAHSATFSPNYQFVLIADLGTDKVYTYQAQDNGKLVPAASPFAQAVPGAGPRHIDFHPSGKYFYLVEEMTSTVGAFSFNQTTGQASVIQDPIQSLPANFTDKNSAADIHVSPDGKFLYMSNRGHNALAIFSISKKGIPTLIGHQPTMGKVPRNFMIDRLGEFVLVAHQETDNIVVFRRDKKTGLLTPVHVEVKVPSPVCLKMLPQIIK